MTGVTLFRAINVAAGFIRLACGDNAIVAAFAYTLRFVVIDRYDRHPSRIVVAGFTEVTGEDMRRAFSTCVRGVVTGDTGLCGRAVIKHGDQPVGRNVTTFARQTGRNVIDAHTGGNDAIMTTRTRSSDLRVIHQRVDGRPCRAVVARFTDARCSDVCRSSASGNHTVMARITTAEHLRMIDQWTHGHPCRVDVTSLAKVSGINMCRRLPTCRCAVMAGDTGIGDAGVIKRRH